MEEMGHPTGPRTCLPPTVARRLAHDGVVRLNVACAVSQPWFSLMIRRNRMCVRKSVLLLAGEASSVAAFIVLCVRERVRANETQQGESLTSC